MKDDPDRGVNEIDFGEGITVSVGGLHAKLISSDSVIGGEAGEQPQSTERTTMHRNGLTV